MTTESFFRTKNFATAGIDLIVVIFFDFFTGSINMQHIHMNQTISIAFENSYELHG
jgi:hypothetical protein